MVREEAGRRRSHGVVVLLLGARPRAGGHGRGVLLGVEHGFGRARGGRRARVYVVAVILHGSQRP